MTHLACRTSIATLLLSISLALPVAASAETIFKWHDKDGIVNYSQSLPPDVDPGRVEKLDIELLSAEQRRAARHWLLAQERKADEALREREVAWSHADADVTSTLASLRQAERGLAAGRTPLPGERLGIVGGGTRLTQVYFDRLQGLEREIVRARHELDRAYDERNALK